MPQQRMQGLTGRDEPVRQGWPRYWDPRDETGVDAESHCQLGALFVNPATDRTTMAPALHPIEPPPPPPEPAPRDTRQTGTHHTRLSDLGMRAHLHARAASLIGVARRAGGSTDQACLVRRGRQGSGVGGG